MVMTSIKNTMKSLLAVLVIFVLATSCSKTESVDLPQSDTELQTRRGKGGGGSTGGGETSVPQVTGLSATATSSTSVSLSWNSVVGATSYWIYRNNNVIAIIQSTSFVDAYASPNTYYTYEIAAVVNSVLGPKSASATVYTP